MKKVWKRTLLIKDSEGYFTIQNIYDCSDKPFKPLEISHRSDEYVDVLTNPKSWTVRKI